MKRKTIKDLEYLVQRLNVRMGVRLEKYLPYKKLGRLVSNIGHFYIDQSYGGFQLQKIVNEGGGCTDVTIRTTKTELYNIIKGMVDILDIKRRVHNDNN